MHVPNISYNRSTSGSLKRAQTPCRHEGSTCKDNSFSVTRFSISNPPSENPAYGPGYDHNLNTDRKRLLWIWSGLFSVAFYENAAVRILRTAITWTRPNFTCATNNPDYIFLWHSKPAPDDRWASSKALQLARVRCNCLSQQHAQLRRLLLSFPKRKLRREVCTNCVIHETCVSQRLANLCFVPNPICHSPTGGRPNVTMPAPRLSLI